MNHYENMCSKRPDFNMQITLHSNSHSEDSAHFLKRNQSKVRVLEYNMTKSTLNSNPDMVILRTTLGGCENCDRTVISEIRHVVKHGLDWTCKPWTGLDLQTMDWTGLVKHGLVKHGLCKTWTCKQGLWNWGGGGGHFLKK